MRKNGALARASVAGGAVALGVGALGAPAAAAAQYEDVPRPAAYALERATVVGADGTRTEGVTVVVRGNLIEALGPGVAVPADATVLEGDSLLVYPGLVDGAGFAAHGLPQPEIDRSELEIWNASRTVQGFLPARRLAPHLKATGADLTEQRREGIVAAAVHPTGAMMPGRGALLLFRGEAETPAELVIQEALGPTFEFRGARGAYPATLFGVTAFIRQALEDAAHRGLEAEAFAANPRGMTTPSPDPDYAVLREVLSGALPVFFEADGAADILRALGLAEEYGFRPVIVDGGEAWKVADELARGDIPVLVSVDFPEPRRWDPESEDSLDAAAEREKRELEDRYANAGRLADAGVRFALTSGGTGDLLEGARKAVEYGLDPMAALAALTRTPAELYGIPHVARVEAGLPATFVVTSGPLFEEETEVVATFVEGWREEAEGPGTEEAGDPDEAVAFGGEWRMTIDTGEERLEGVLRVEQDGATFEGELELEGETLEVIDGTIDGSDIRCVAVMRQGGERLDVEITGSVEGDRASGEADAGPLGTAQWTALRTGPGGER